MLEKNESPVASLQNEDLQEIARSAGELPTLPGIATMAMQLIDDPNVNVKELQAVIARDQALTARILKIVNSAMYCFEREVSTLTHAIAILGLETVRSVIVAACVQQILNSATSKDLTTQLFWSHSWGAAVAARAIAVASNYPVVEEAFTCGLLHDMGKMVLLKNRGNRYREILNDVYRGDTTCDDAERQAFGFSHAHVGALLASKWLFPAQLAEGILYHHDFAGAAEYPRLAAIAALADRMMVVLEVGFTKNKSLQLEDEPSAAYLKLSAPVLHKLTSDVQTMIRALPGFIQL